MRVISKKERWKEKVYLSQPEEMYTRVSSKMGLSMVKESLGIVEDRAVTTTESGFTTKLKERASCLMHRGTYMMEISRIT